jgi:hypothetical protein
MLRAVFSGRGDAVIEPKPTGVDDGQPFHNPMREGLPTIRESVRR